MNKETSEYVFVLRTCKADMTSPSDEAKGFCWPESGPVTCNNWDPTPECSNGLHGLLWGAGNGGLLLWDVNARWLVVRVLTSEIVVIDNKKVKFPRGEVVYCGDRQGATQYIWTRAPAGTVVVGHTANAGDGGTATAGDGGTANAGYRGTANAGYRGTANAGYRGTANAGDDGTANAGYRGTANAGEYGVVQIKWWDEQARRYRIAVGYVGENDIQPNVTYRCDEQGRLVPIKECNR